MTGPEVLASAAVGAVIASLVNGIFNWRLKRQELERQDLTMALKMSELKNQQMVTLFQADIAGGGTPGITMPDPLVNTIEYHKGIKEYRKTGRWTKGEAGH